MHFAMSMSKRDMTRPPAALSFSASITMQSIGQARSQARQAVQISRSTSSIPGWRKGSVSWTRTPSGSRSGYWTVYGFRTRCDAVTARPSAIVTAASLMFRRYAPRPITRGGSSGEAGNAGARERVEAELVAAESRAAEVVADAPEEQDDQPECKGGECRPHDPEPVGEDDHPDRRPEEVHERERHEVFPAHH